MGLLDKLGIRSARDAPAITDSVRDSGQTFTFGRADSGERVDEKSAMQIATVYACVRLLAETVAGLPLREIPDGQKKAGSAQLLPAFFSLSGTGMDLIPGFRPPVPPRTRSCDSRCSSPSRCRSAPC